MPHLIVPDGVNQAIACGTQQPRFGLFGNTVHRPFLQRDHEGFAQGILRAGDIARARREERDQPAIRIARQVIDGGVCRGFAHAWSFRY